MGNNVETEKKDIFLKKYKERKAEIFSDDLHVGKKPTA